MGICEKIKNFKQKSWLNKRGVINRKAFYLRINK